MALKTACIVALTRRYRFGGSLAHAGATFLTRELAAVVEHEGVSDPDTLRAAAVALAAAGSEHPETKGGAVGSFLEAAAAATAVGNEWLQSNGREVCALLGQPITA
jgi:hypothetical protein